MGRVLNELLTHVLSRLLPPEEWLAALALALALWMLDYALIELRRRRWGYVVLLLAMGAVPFWFALADRWSNGSLVRIGIFGLTFYVPFWIVRHRAGGKRRRPSVQQMEKD